jgi:hypothetical protein
VQRVQSSPPSAGLGPLTAVSVVGCGGSLPRGTFPSASSELVKASFQSLHLGFYLDSM